MTCMPSRLKYKILKTTVWARCITSVQAGVYKDIQELGKLYKMQIFFPILLVY